VMPEGWDQRIAAAPPVELGQALERLRGRIAVEVRALPGHRQTLERQKLL